MAFEEIKSSGITSSTPENIMLGAGTIHQGLTYSPDTYKKTTDVAIATGKTYYTRSGTDGSYVYTAVAEPVVGSIGNYYEVDVAGHWNFDASVIGATQGGNKLSIKPTVKQIEVDGAWVKVKEFDIKQGGEATLEVNMIEVTPDLMKSALIAEENTDDAPTGYTLLEDKAKIEAGDYITNLGFIGQTLDGLPVVIIFDYALCTSGFEVETKNKDESVIKYTFEARRGISGDLKTLPYHVYYADKE